MDSKTIDQGTLKNFYRKMGIGRSLTEIRQKKGLSLRKLAEQINDYGYGHILSHVQLEKFEKDEAYPNMIHLALISQVLSVPLGTIIKDVSNPDGSHFAVTRKEKYFEKGEKRKRFGTGGKRHQLLSERGKYKYYELDTNILKFMQPTYFEVDYHLDVKEGTDGHEGEEFIVIISGELDYYYSRDNQIQEPINLKEGDTLAYNSNVPHAFVSARSGETAKAIVVFCNLGSLEQFEEED